MFHRHNTRGRQIKETTLTSPDSQVALYLSQTGAFVSVLGQFAEGLFHQGRKHGSYVRDRTFFTKIIQPSVRPIRSEHETTESWTLAQQKPSVRTVRN